MRDLAVLFLHLLATVARLAGPGGARAVVAESVLVKQQLLILNRSRKRSRPWRRRPLRSGSRGRPSRRAEPCPGSASFSRGHPRRLNDENSRGKVQNVRAHSSAPTPGHGRIVGSERLGGLLKYYHRPAA
jgi:hypothetical protein